MEVTTYAIDLAKNKFQVHGFDSRGERRLAETLKRRDLLEFFETRSGRGEVVMEACSGAHHWGRRLTEQGYQVRLIPPQFVKPFVVGNKTDANDADGIFEASRRTQVRPVPVKTIEQQDALLVHGTREQWVKTRTALVNQIRGELAERGLAFPQSTRRLRPAIVDLLSKADAGVDVSPAFQAWLRQRLADWGLYDERVKGCDQALREHYEASPACQHIGEANGVGIMTATATIAYAGNAHQFRSGRQFSAWLGLTPREHSSGEKRHLGGITKRGNPYLRTLFIHGARAVIQAHIRRAKAGKPMHERDAWIRELIARRGFNKACVALANKNARIVWAMLNTGEVYRAPQQLAA